MLLVTMILLGCSLLAVPAAAERLISPPVREANKLALRQHRATRSASVADVGECILLFGPFCNGESSGVSRVAMMRWAMVRHVELRTAGYICVPGLDTGPVSLRIHADNVRDSYVRFLDSCCIVYCEGLTKKVHSN